MSNYVFVIDQKKSPQNPIHPALARLLLNQKKAAVFRIYPFTIILKEEKESTVTQSLELKIDPGSKTTGIAIDEVYLNFPSNLDWDSIKEVRILPRNGAFYAEYVYSMESSNLTLNPNKVLGIDHGINNWLTCVSNTGTSFIVDGRHLKSLNQWYNKRVSELKEGQAQGFWSKQLSRITEKRNRQVRDAINKAARLVINHCLDNQIGKVVLGWNQGQKQEVELGKRNNQQFVQIPTGRLKERIRQLCTQYHIEFVETEESYTSQCSFLDNDDIPTYGEKPDGWKSSGRRVKRGLYRTANNRYINADANGAANILRKVARTLGLNLEELGSGALTTPLRVRIWTLVRIPQL